MSTTNPFAQRGTSDYPVLISFAESLFSENQF